MHLAIICINRKGPRAVYQVGGCYCFPPDAINTNKTVWWRALRFSSSSSGHNHEYELRETDRKTIYVEPVIFKSISHVSVCGKPHV